jgi:hypothetical protein
MRREHFPKLVGRLLAKVGGRAGFQVLQDKECTLALRCQCIRDWTPGSFRRQPLGQHETLGLKLVQGAVNLRREQTGPPLQFVEARWTARKTGQHVHLVVVADKPHQHTNHMLVNGVLKPTGLRVEWAPRQDNGHEVSRAECREASA